MRRLRRVATRRIRSVSLATDARCERPILRLKLNEPEYKEAKIQKPKQKWAERELNPHGSCEPQDFKSCASASSAIRPLEQSFQTI